MIETDAEWLRALADLVEKGEVDVGRVELQPRGVMFGLFPGGYFARKRELEESSSKET